MQKIINLFKKIKNLKNKKSGFTLIEILVVIGIIGILATIVLVAVNPGKQFKQARDTQRVANINAILNAIGQNMSDHQGILYCNGLQIPNFTGFKLITSTAGDENFDLAECLVPEYLSKLPFDPDTSGKSTLYTNEDNYNTGYSLYIDEDNRITIKALGEIEETLTVTR